MSNNGGTQLSPELLGMILQGVTNSTNTIIGPDDDIAYHEDGSKNILVPAGMSMESLADVATRKAEEMNKEHSFHHDTAYRPWDGAYAAMNVIKRMFGMSIGQDTRTMFGNNPPAFRQISIGYNQKAEVPWGRVEIPALPGCVLVFDDGYSNDYGPIFHVTAVAPKKHKQAIEAFFSELDKELAQNSIYRGHALWGAHELTYMNVDSFKASEIVFSDQVQATLDASIFTVVENTVATVEAGLPTKRSVLLYGPYGTGKSSMGLIAAQRATAAGWTFLSAKAGKDQLKPVLQTAALYEPAVVFVEDADAITPNEKDKDGISELLDLLDGIASKSSRIVLIMTTNHIKRIPAGMLRPGRLDYVVEVAGLDRGGVEKLIGRVVRHDLLAADIDYDAIFAEMADWQPAWVRAAADRAQSFAIARSGGKLTYGLTTEDFVTSARSLAPQLTLMDTALEGYKTPEFTDAFKSMVSETVADEMDGWSIVDRDADKVMEIAKQPTGITW